jgi:hypothetical protein
MYDAEFFYSGCQNNVPFQPADNLVYAGKNSQIKARKSELRTCQNWKTSE